MIKSIIEGNSLSIDKESSYTSYRRKDADTFSYTGETSWYYTSSGYHISNSVPGYTENPKGSDCTIDDNFLKKMGIIKEVGPCIETWEDNIRRHSRFWNKYKN